MITGTVILEYTMKELFSGEVFLPTDIWEELKLNNWEELVEELREHGYDDTLIKDIEKADPGEMGMYIYVDPEKILLKNGNEKFEAGDKLTFEVPYEFYVEEYAGDSR